MAEIGLVANVIAVIDLSAKVASRCSKYNANVKNARDDIERLKGENQRLKETFEQVKTICDSPKGAKLQASQDLRDGVKDCRLQLAQLETQLEPRTRRRVIRPFRIPASKWPLKSDEVDGIIEKLGRCRDKISSSLQVDQSVIPTPSAPIVYRPSTLSVSDTTNLKAPSPAPTPSLPVSNNVQASTTQPVSIPFSNPGAHILEKALERLTQQERDVLNIHIPTSETAVGSVLDSALKEAEEKQKVCRGKSWSCKVGKHEVRARDAAEKVVKWLDRFKSVLDVAVSADPIHAALPWAAVRVVLEIATAEQRQMTALLSGLDIILFMGHRIVVYENLLRQTAAGKARENLVAALIRLQVLILQFLAEAISWSGKGLAERSWSAFWKDNELSTFESGSQKLALEVEVEAKGCDRDLVARMFDKLKILTDLSESMGMVLSDLALSKLPFASGARFDSQKDDEKVERECLNNTRVDLLHQIEEWAESSTGECIFWLNGMAGTGKSTVSRTVARNFNKSGQLGASFFFSRGPGDRGNAKKLFTTIAHQLTYSVPEVVPSLEKGIRDDFDVLGQSFEQQFDKFILQPLATVSTDGRHIVIVIDALDECEQDKHIPNILQLLARSNEVKKVCLRIFLTSRPEGRIHQGFKNLPKAQHRIVVLDDFINTDRDILTYVRQELVDIRRKRVPNDPNWPGEESTQELVRMAVPLFICAFTLCRFLEDDDQPARKQLEILKTSGLAGQVSQLERLDIMYKTIFEQLPQGKEALRKEFHRIVGTIVVLAEPLSVHALASLLEIDVEIISLRLERLRSVIQIHESKLLPVSLFHLSFAEFLLDPVKKQDKKRNWFSVDQAETHKIIAEKCLNLMSREGSLKKDCCVLRKPGVTRFQIDRQVIDKHLSHDVRYACRYWVYHIEKSDGLFCDTMAVLDFLQAHLLHWFEALGWMGWISEGVIMINTLRSLFDSYENSKLNDFLYDAYRFLLNCRSIADTSPLQLYSAALIFAPKESVVRDTFQDYIPDWISQKPEVELSWNAILQTLEGHSSSVWSVAFSHDSKLLASASVDETVRIWDAATGKLQQTLEGHSDSVWSVAFSHDSKLLASASDDKTVRIWDAATGKLQQTLEGHSGSVWSVAFSHDSKLLASASDDKTVRIWDAATGKLQQTLEGHSYWVWSVAFSHDSKLLASASDDKTVRIWDAATGKLQQTLEGHSDWVWSVAFSHDSKLLASASGDKTVRIWDAVTGKLQQTLEGHSDSVWSVAFSHDSKLLASASDDKTVRIWDAATGKLQQTLEGHSDSVWSVAFSHDSKLLASASGDKTVRIWDAATGKLQQTLEGHSDSVWSVAFSHDSKLLASASVDETVRIWDAATGKLQQTLEGHSDSVRSVAFSHDSKLLASASDDKTVRIWDAATGKLQQTLEGHSDSVWSVAFSHDSKLLASASVDETVRIWDAATGKLQQTLEGHSDWVWSVAFSHDSKLLASASVDETVRIWDAATGKLQQTLEGHSGLVRSVAFSHDSKLLASASVDKTVRIWDAATGKLLQIIAANSYISTLSFDVTNSILITNIGRSKVDGTEKLALPISSQNLDDKSDYKGLGVSEVWVTWNGKNLLWLPPNFRAVTFNISPTGLILAIGCQSGKVFLVGISLDTLI